MILGVHSTITGGLSKALEHTCMLGCNTVQIFHRSPRSLRTKPVEPDEAADFKKKKKSFGIEPVVIHAVYTQNFSSSNGKFYRLSIKEFVEDLQDAHDLGAEYVVTHLGSHKGIQYKEGMGKVIAALEEIAERTPKGVTVLFENICGARNLIGGEFYQFGYILDRIKHHKNIGLCLDTCHAWCAGYDVKTPAGLDKMVFEIEALTGVDRIKVIHLNDTKEGFGSKKDRHCEIGAGEIGLDGIGNIINHPALRDKPFILETPKKNEDDDDKNVAIVRSLRKK